MRPLIVAHVYDDATVPDATQAYAAALWRSSCSRAARRLPLPVSVRWMMAVLIQRNMGLLVLAIWLILYGLSGMVALGLPAPLMGILALIAGVLILAGR